jgi:hypothetical protein
MKNGDTYLGTILLMDVNDKVVIKLQDGTAEELKFKDINSFKKIESENTSQTANPNIVIQNTNTNENIIGSTVASVYSGPKEIIKFVASTNRTPTKCVFQGVEYPIRNIKELQIFYDVLKIQYPNLDREILLMFDSLITLHKDIVKKGTDCVLYGSIGMGVGLLLMFVSYKSELYLPMGIAGGLAIISEIVAIAGVSNSNGIKDFNEPVKNIVGKFNFIYAK